ncbi:hypothetical protein BDV37DRAFT_100240 [Aspergillus pseudonomiae]|uniref:Uncharacterized protein n=1 Tax=Aspergillus pseudonomiae TaxID=1506151 RepID=A0A5N7CRB5_9EURO|nr:uncharacterized protein BDV37DRAFT_100240 [Aspergillus pseudonomiae]KAE8396792.1 hypothetical protein BDV37DRAFT_100240 [Aspergillus pseudonomiae]
MPKRRPQPSTPPDLPTPPAGASKKPYYVAGDAIWYCRERSMSYVISSICYEGLSKLCQKPNGVKVRLIQAHRAPYCKRYFPFRHVGDLI